MVSLAIVDVYDDFYKHSENEGKKLSTLKSLKTTRNHLAQFCIANPTLVNNFTDKVYNAFIAWMVSNFEYQPNSLELHTKNLNTFFIGAKR